VLVLTKPEIFIVSPLLLNTLRILVLVEAADRSFRLSFKVLLPEPLSKYAIDHLGNENANTLTGTSRDEIFVAGAGDDTLTGEAANRSFRLSFKVLLPEPLISIISIS
jgi:hypothetical protein